MNPALNSQAATRARKLLESYSRSYPAGWKSVDYQRTWRGKRYPEWPSWCFLPIAGACDIVKEVHDVEFNLHEVVIEGSILAALAAWRVSQGVYQIDTTVYQALIDTPLTGDIPCEVLYRLPQWCVYLETPGMQFDGFPLHGTFAHLEYNPHHPDRPELRLVLDHDHPDKRFKIASIFLGNWSLREAVDRSLRPLTSEMSSIYADGGQNMRDSVMALSIPVLEPIVSVLLYLCSLSADYGDVASRPSNPQPKKTKDGLRLFPPNAPTKWLVAVRMGAALRGATSGAANDQQNETVAKNHSSSRPHVRRAHWHGFWTGTRNGERHFDVRWLPPIPVNVVDFAELPTVLHPVGGSPNS
jgi:hypothetical protein